MNWDAGFAQNIDATRIGPKLHQGSEPPRGTKLRRAGFDVVVLCAMEIQPPSSAFVGVEVLHYGIDDGPVTPMLWTRANRAAKAVARRIRAGKRVLVTCAMGRNRSGLVVALALRELTGRSGARIVRHVRSLRANALTNPHFERALTAHAPHSVSP